MTAEGNDLSNGYVAIGSPTQHGQPSLGSADFIEPAPRYTSLVSPMNLFQTQQQPKGLSIANQSTLIARVPVGRNSISPRLSSMPFVGTPQTSTRTSPNVGGTPIPNSSNPLLSPTWQSPNTSYTYDGGGFGPPRNRALGEDITRENNSNAYGDNLEHHNDRGDQRSMNSNNDNDNDNDDNDKSMHLFISLAKRHADAKNI